MKPSIEAKKDRRLRESGKLIKFVYKNEEYPLEPKDFFITGFTLMRFMEMSN